jgi:RNA polymerase sigma factor (sigma-70 family)
MVMHSEFVRRGDIADLVDRSRNGDQQAWDELVERYAPLIWSICRGHRLSRPDTDDVGQAVWLQLIQHLDELRDPAALPGWLVTTARRECGRVLRAASRHSGSRHIDGDVVPDELAATVEQEVLAAECRAALRRAFLDQAPADQRLLMLLMADPPLSYAEISAKLNIPVGSIGPTRQRCLRRLRRHPALTALTEEQIAYIAAIERSSNGTERAFLVGQQESVGEARYYERNRSRDIHR